MTAFNARQTILIEGYFDLRQHSSLKDETGRFEALPWCAVGKSMVRTSADGYKLIVGQVESDIEVCIVASDGTEKSFAQPMVS
jgi:hypothetical protein